MFKIIYLLIFILLIGNLFVVLKNHIGFRRRQKMIDEYHDFSMQVLEWVREIKDQNKRSELLYYHITYISNNSMEEIIPKWKQIPEFQKYIEDTWSIYIPSLKKQVREKKIESILKFKK